MNLRFTYREFTLVFGVLVALLVGLTLWVNLAKQDGDHENASNTPAIGLPVVQGIVKKSVSVIESFSTINLK